jgi:SAM-dependent methyltransferase
MASYIPAARDEHSLCLDLGCGNGEYRRPLEKLGYRWIGTDYSNPEAPIWSDAHALPMADQSFDLVVSLAVLEHLRYPDVALREVFRVLKPGGVFCGSVTYLVPFHDTDSYYNMTHSGVYSSLLDAGFHVERIASDPIYLGVRAISYTGLFLGASRRLAYAMVAPVVAAHRFWWWWNRRRRRAGFSRDRQLLLTTGAFFFVGEKPRDKRI